MSEPAGAILADPPWSFKSYSAKGLGRSAQAHYNCMPLPAIKALPVAELAARDCVLFLWATGPMLPQALETMAAWGFTYKTMGFTWAKRTKHGKWHIGNGFWTRANSEHVLLGTRGKPKRLSAAVRMLIEAPVREHSRKPAEIKDRIAQLVAGPYLELFSRETTDGWSTAYSDQAGLLDGVAVKTRRLPSRKLEQSTVGQGDLFALPG